MPIVFIEYPNKPHADRIVIMLKIYSLYVVADISP